MCKASNNDSAFIDELKKTIAEIVDDGLGSTVIDSAWLTNMDRLCHRVLTSDPGDFLQWDVILRTMVVGNAEFVRDELNFLKVLPDWKSRWENAIEESTVGNPTLYDDFPSSSGNLIHQAYHLAQFEKKTGIDISRASLVFEFGGGYGSMCRLVHKLNFCGRYVIFDLPPWSALQNYYLNMNGIPSTYSNENSKRTTNGTFCVSQFERLEAILSEHISCKDAIFIANWSLSESPVNLRHSILSLVKQFNAFLLAYQGFFGNVDNVDFFEKWTDTMKNIEWHNWKIEHLPSRLYRDNYYLMGENILNPRF